jgi:predicted acylesterase/phospholipase RssA
MSGTWSDIPFECDLVMKGGITSGIVYPPAVVEIAKDHRLRNIGGSSAGAIAAAAAAAAELGRFSKSGGFELLATLPKQLSEVDRTGRTRLQRLFQAQPSTTDLFDLFWLVRSTKGKQRRSGAIQQLNRHGTVPRLVNVTGIAGSLIAAALLVAAILTAQGWGIASATILFAIVSTLWLVGRRIARAVTGAVRLAKDAPDAVAANYHGLCNGRTSAGPDDPGLTDWLHDTLQALGGRNDDGVDQETRARPITYGDLSGAGVELITMTTDVTRGTAEMFPLRGGGWAFDEKEMRTLFPDAVVDYLVMKAPVPEEADRRAALEEAGLSALPPPDDLPIVLGARMSLSFPFLLSAIPLYAWVPQRVAESWKMRYVRCWLSDGGITSNLPVHLFDRPLPSRPTYAINLGGGGDPAADCGNIWRPLGAGAGRHPGNGPIMSTVQFMSAVFDTMQNWSDNSLVRAPGYRDRICTVRLGEGEGGMNLDMSSATIDRLARRGALAGENLAWIRRGTAGSCPAPPTADAQQLSHQWDRHRFIRYRTFLGGLARYLADAHAGFDGPGNYSSLGQRAVLDAWFPYRSGWTNTRHDGIAADVRTMFGLDLRRMAQGTPAGSALGFNARATDFGKR